MPSNKRQRDLARRRSERQSARRAAERARRRKRNLVLYSTTFGVVLLLVLSLTVGKSLFDDEGTVGATPTETPTPSRAPGECAYNDADEAPAKDVGKPPVKADATTQRHATVTLDSGVVEFDMFADKAPCTVNSFVHLASKNYFDSSPCHRATSSPGLTVLQCGDPTGTGSSGPGYQFDNENLPTPGPDGKASYPRGTVAMANAGAGTNGSQFFLVVKDSTLGPDYTAFGKITKGLDVLDKVIAAGTTPAGDGKPKKTVTIKDFTIVGKAPAG